MAYVHAIKAVYDEAATVLKNYADIYCDTRAEALTITATNYITGSKLYIVPTGEMFVACSSGWYDVDGTLLS